MRRLVVSSCFCFCFSFIGSFCFCLCFCLCFCSGVSVSSGASIRTRGEPCLARCLLGPDGDESGLLSKARPMTAKPLRAVTRTRDRSEEHTSELQSLRHLVC